MEKQILIRCDSGSDIGLGHLMRCLTLANDLKSIGYAIDFASINLLGNKNEKITEQGFGLLDVASNHPSELLLLMQEKSYLAVILDSYAIDFYFEKELRAKSGAKIICFDDEYKKHHADIIINHAIYVDSSRYNPNTLLLAGSTFSLLRGEFFEAKPKRYKKIDPTKPKILLSFGGSDPSNITTKVYSILKRDIPNAQIGILTTYANPNLSILRSLKADLFVEPGEVAKLMKSYDMAICATSGSLIELIYLQLPFVSVLTASNQQPFADTLHKLGFAKSLDGSTELNTLNEALETLVAHQKEHVVACKAIPFAQGNLAKAIDRYLTA